MGVYFLGGFVVWIVHRYPLHQRWRWLPYPYKAHTLMHHRYFTHERYECREKSQLYHIFFPPLVIIGFALIYLPVGYLLLSFLLGKQWALVYLMGSCLYFVLYETIHFISHLPAENPLLAIAPLKKMWCHHRIHHNPLLMQKFNFGIVDPLADWAFGTIYRLNERESKRGDTKEY